MSGLRLEWNAILRHTRHHISTAMNRIGMCHRADDGQSVRNLRRLRQSLANAQPRQRGLNGSHLALDFRTGLRFGIERLMLRW